MDARRQRLCPSGMMSGWISVADLRRPLDESSGSSERGDGNPIIEGPKSVVLQRLRIISGPTQTSSRPLVGAALMTQDQSERWLLGINRNRCSRSLGAPTAGGVEVSGS